MTNFNTKLFEKNIEENELTLLNLEKIGSLFLILGYLHFISASNISKDEIIKKYSTENISPSLILVNGEKFILLGLTLLYTVSLNQVNLIFKRNLISKIKLSLEPYKKLRNSYYISVLANMLRVEAFEEIHKEAKYIE